jgi:LmbE family N-acetylglucosaminyl deacetylase
MPYPRLRPLANRIRGVRAPLLYRWGLRRGCIAATVTDAPALIIAPHHDDETFGCGGLIALKRRSGVPVQVVFITDGSQSHRDSPVLQTADIVATRKKEAIAACEILGLSAGDLQFLDAPDGQLAEISGVERGEMVRRLAEIVMRSGAGEICVPHHKDCHPDHEATHALVLDAMDLAGNDADVLEYPIWLLWKRTLLDWGIHDLAGAERVDVSAAQPAKSRAIDVYASQLVSMPRGFVPQFQLGEEFFWRHHLADRRNRGAATGAAMIGSR